MKTTGLYPRVHVDAAEVPAVGQAGGVLLTETVRAVGVDRALSAALSPWRKPLAVHDPGKIVLDLAVSLALGGDALADVAVLRGEPGVYGPVASDATVSRLIALLAGDADHAIAAISVARRHARRAAWELAGEHAPDHRSAVEPVVIDLDATLVTPHSEKEHAAATFKRGFGFHPLCAFADHGQGGTGEPLVIQLRPGNAGSNTASDHIAVTEAALAQLPTAAVDRPAGSVLVRADGAGGTKAFVGWLSAQRLSYSVGFTLPFDTPQLYRLILDDAWEAAFDADGQPREGAAVTEITTLLDLDDWPDGMRVIIRRERPHPGAQLRFGDVDGYRLTAFATNTTSGQLADLELRHRRRARCEDRIRTTKDTGLRNLPLHGFDQNRIWCQIVALASEITAWMGLLGHPHTDARRWEPKRLRYRLFTIPATIIRTGRRVILHLSNRSRWARIVVAAIIRLRALPAPSG